MTEAKRIAVLGVFVADAAFRASRQPRMGETLIGSGFALGPGGKGSNQAVAAARLGSEVSFITRIGDDAFGKMARDLWNADGIESLATADPRGFTGAAYIFVDEKTGDNAIIVVPGAGGEVSPADVESHRAAIESADVFLTQLETTMEASLRGLEIAKEAGTIAIFNPAPAAPIDGHMLSVSDYVMPNESEAELLTGIAVASVDDAAKAAAELRRRGASSVIVTLGDKGAYFDDGSQSCHIPPCNAGPVVETTGAGDSFCGAFAHALAHSFPPVDAARYACAAASISVTRPGTAPSMPTAGEVDALVGKMTN